MEQFVFLNKRKVASFTGMKDCIILGAELSDSLAPPHTSRSLILYITCFLISRLLELHHF